MYLARDIELGTLRAVKMLPPEKKREAGLLRLMEHPAIPGMIDLVQTEEFCCLVMEYIRGRSLREYLDAGKVFSVWRLLDIGMEAAEVLQYLHTQKPPVFYGDLKPENLMLGENGKLYLVDFGSAVTGYQEQQNLCLGTKGFAAPEQYEGRISAVSDVYALGKTLRVLAGKHWAGMLIRVPDLFFFVKKCCKKQEKQRFQDMREVSGCLHKMKAQKSSRGYVVMLLVFILLSLFLSGLFLTGRKPAFKEALTEVTEKYKEEIQNSRNRKRKTTVLQETEAELQRLLREYPEKEYQERLLLLLAANEELRGESLRAALYYEQCMLYLPECPEGYEEYGLFLWRCGQKEASIRLWEEYQKKIREGMLPGEDEKSFNYLKWRETLNAWRKKKSQTAASDRSSVVWKSEGVDGR